MTIGFVARGGIALLWFTALFDGVLVRMLAGTPIRLGWRDLVLAGLLALTVIVPEARRRARAVPLWPLLVWAAAGVLSLALSDVAPDLAVRGLRATFWWVTVVYVSAAWVEDRHVRRGLVLLVPVLAGIVVFAGWQVLVGREHLLDLGYEYGLNIREAAGRVRAFGTFVYDGPFAHSMAVFAVAYVGFVTAARSRRERLVAVAGLLLCLLGILLALNRAAFLAAVVGGAVVAWTLRGAPVPDVDWRRLGRVAAVAAVVAVAVLAVRGGDFFVSVLDPQTDSVADRLRIWPTLVAVDDPVLGDGPGVVGAAAFTEDITAGAPVATAARHVTDNYYLATFAQYGIVGVVALVAFLVLLWRALGRPARGGAPWLAATGRGAVTFLAFVMVIVNLWDDFPTPVFLWTFVGAAVAAARPQTHGTPDGVTSPADAHSVEA
jgi:hypothetical protein